MNGNKGGHPMGPILQFVRPQDVFDCATLTLTCRGIRQGARIGSRRPRMPSGRTRLRLLSRVSNSTRSPVARVSEGGLEGMELSPGNIVHCDRALGDDVTQQPRHRRLVSIGREERLGCHGKGMRLLPARLRSVASARDC